MNADSLPATSSHGEIEGAKAEEKEFKKAVTVAKKAQE